ncbi:hypothetical protein AMJ40_00195 [candidate division TA06 bacterium DG_26]|uniref:Uncharacterized protein n=1 Tax=candidate division TA06 bacterium DG_26 TaxID=1703771 RepID=A0A0S7WP02_UNCT6|nr:MAG: hypothetical protein AMJ40_00195 [candidate division TA06 bacterium DG_26]
MKYVKWQTLLGLALVILSAIFYFIHYTIFRDPHHIFIYLVGDIAFVFIEVLLVTLIIHELLSQREKRARLEKLNMVIGTFFSEVGTELLAYFSDFDPSLDRLKGELAVKNDWAEKEFQSTAKRLREYNYEIDIQRIDPGGVRDFLMSKRDFLLRLLENPTLLEHERFTGLLRAVFHLTEELAGRKSLKELPDSDYAHLKGDMKRVYVILVHQWLDYMKHLKGNYPYLFSLAMRTNPFDQNASIVVK